MFGVRIGVWLSLVALFLAPITPASSQTEVVSAGAALEHEPLVRGLAAPPGSRRGSAPFQAPPGLGVFLPTLANGYQPELVPIVSADTVVVTGSLAQALAGQDRTTGILTFTQSATDPITLTVGQVLASGPLPAAPYGFLRRVTALTQESDQVVVQTAAATLEDALVQGDFRFSQTLTAADVMTSALPAGLTVQTPEHALAAVEIVLRFREVVLVDGDNNPSTTDDQVRVTGEVKLRPVVSLKARIEGAHLSTAEFRIAGTLTTDLTPKLGVTLGTLDGFKTVATIPIVPFLVLVGPVPVTVTPQITLMLGAEGKLDASVKLGGVTSTTQLNAGATYVEGTVTPVAAVNSTSAVQGFDAGFGATFKLYVAPRFEVSFDGFLTAGPTATVKLYLSLETKTYEIPWWKIYCGVEVPIELRLDVFGHNLASYLLPKVVDFRELLLEGRHHDLFAISLSPPSPGRLSLMQPVRVDFSYVTDEPQGVRIWAVPYSNGSPCCAYSPSVVLPYGYGRSDRSITLLAGNAHVDLIKLQMQSADQARLLLEVPINVDYTFGP